MQTELILAVVGDDRPGMVQDAANCVREVGGNWLESRMTRLAGKFAGVVRVSLPEASTAVLVEKLESLEGMSIHVEPAGTLEDNPQLRAFTISIIGPDRPGILDEVTRALRKSAISVVELQTRVGPAPMTGDQTFFAEVDMLAPPDTDIGTLESSLDEIAESLGVEILLEH